MVKNVTYGVGKAGYGCAWSSDQQDLLAVIAEAAGDECICLVVQIVLRLLTVTLHVF